MPKTEILIDRGQHALLSRLSHPRTVNVWVPNVPRAQRSTAVSWLGYGGKFRVGFWSCRATGLGYQGWASRLQHPMPWDDASWAVGLILGWTATENGLQKICYVRLA